MNNALIFDVDGVVRDIITPILGFYPTEWHWTKDGKDVYDFIKTDLSVLLTAPPTIYCHVIKTLPYIQFLSCQPDDWKRYTERWLFNHFPNSAIRIRYVKKHEEKLEHLTTGLYLVDDYPLFNDYSRVILIDYPYNKNLNVPRRVSTPEQLRELVYD